MCAEMVVCRQMTLQESHAFASRRDRQLKRQGLLRERRGARGRPHVCETGGMREPVSGETRMSREGASARRTFGRATLREVDYTSREPKRRLNAYLPELLQDESALGGQFEAVHLTLGEAELNEALERLLGRRTAMHP